MAISWEMLSSFLEATIRLAAPLILVGIGGVFVERSGIFNIGMEGMMLIGALAAVSGMFFFNNIIIATLLAMAAGGLLALIHAYLTITRRTDQIVSGAAINILALGLTNLLSRQFFQDVRPRVDLYPVLAPESLQNIPVLGPLFFSQPVIVWLAFILPPIAAWILFRTKWGLNIRGTGENPQAVATAGLSVYRLKYTGVIISGLFAGLGGSALALAELGYFVPNMTAGRGFIVLAALVLGKWNPILVACACLLFGAADAFQLRMQTFGAVIPYQFLVMLPYVLTILALVGFVGRTVAPKTAGKPYDPDIQ